MQQSRKDFIKESTATVAGLAGGFSLLSLLAGCSDNKKGKKIKLLSTNGEVVEVDEDSVIRSIPEMTQSSHPVREGIPGRKFVMVFDLAKCKGAGKCLSACSKMHYLPPERSYIKLTKMTDADLSSPYWMPSPCFHYDNPPCVKVCPVGATFKLSDGIVGIDNNRCIGCRFCMAACPYSARVFNWGDSDFELRLDEFEQITPHETCSDHQRGTVEKCDFCPHNIVQDKLPDCVTGCPYGAIYFGDENEDSVTNGDETVRLSELLRDKAGYRYLEELGTKPRVYYLPPVDRQFPFEDRKLDRTKYL